MPAIELCDKVHKERWHCAIRASEHCLMSAICTFEKASGYTVIRSEKFPNFYAGNGLAIECAQPSRTLEDWETLFKLAFPTESTNHITLTFSERAFSEILEYQAKHSGFHVYREVGMVVSPQNVATEPDTLLRLLSMTTPGDRETLRRLHLAEAREQDWYTDEAAFDALFAKTMALTDRCDINWIAVPHHDTKQQGRLASALGFFMSDDLCRLQEVITAPDCRKRGHATTLLREVARLAAINGVEAMGLLAENKGDGASLYHKLGFRTVGCDVTLMKY